MGPQLEKLMTPFRSAAITISSPDGVWNKLAPFLYALALQCYRNNYAWKTELDDNSKLIKAVDELIDYKERLVTEHVKDGVPDGDLLMRYVGLSLLLLLLDSHSHFCYLPSICLESTD